MLNKLSKVGTIKQLSGAPIQLESRRSRRTPYGTGASVTTLTESDPAARPRFYNPKSFECLKLWLEALPTFVQHRAWQPFVSQLDRTSLGQEALAAAQQLGAEGALTRLERVAPKDEDLWVRTHEWFDALKTLRFLHLLRDAVAPQHHHPVLLDESISAGHREQQLG